ncbi:hypothetical protein PS934_03262 [Pseudomonas fluorescens]|uniref:hypothetical protein n=1 Tax=Pseudomonas fluorescens TaxID=294 RepID=UPI00123F93E4|nr:hypothetical protein [Pseudomonas fluorescens]VVQ07829.1 hypothetical protein PS934_03262 [Pseudomonas fluorescens]
MSALDELRRRFPDATPETIGLLGLLLSLTFLEDDPATEEARWQNLEPLMGSMVALTKTLNAEQNDQFADIVAGFFILGDTLVRPHVKSKVERQIAFDNGPLCKRNNHKAAAIEYAKVIATEIWDADIEQNIRIGEMAERVWARLINEGLDKWLPDKPESIRKWIQPAAPPYALKGGRPRKTP